MLRSLGRIQASSLKQAVINIVSVLSKPWLVVESDNHSATQQTQRRGSEKYQLELATIETALAIASQHTSGVLTKTTKYRNQKGKMSTGSYLSTCGCDTAGGQLGAGRIGLAACCRTGQTYSPPFVRSTSASDTTNQPLLRRKETSKRICLQLRITL